MILHVSFCIDLSIDLITVFLRVHCMLLGNYNVDCVYLLVGGTVSKLT